MSSIHTLLSQTGAPKQLVHNVLYMQREIMSTCQPILCIIILVAIKCKCFTYVLLCKREMSNIRLMILLVHHACTSFIVYIHVHTMKNTLTLLCDMGVTVLVFKDAPASCM